MIKNIILDVGNVLVNFRRDEYLEDFGFEPELEKKLMEVVFDSQIWFERDRGYHTEEECIEQFVESAPELEKEIRMIFADIDRVVEPYPFSAEWIQGMKHQGKNVYILSNYSKDLFEYGLKHYDFFQYVDGIVVSYEVHQLKPEPEIYETIISKFQLNPEETVFLDDLPQNIEGAAKFGIHTIHVTSHEAAVKGLKEYGIESQA